MKNKGKKKKGILIILLIISIVSVFWLSQDNRAKKLFEKAKSLVNGSHQKQFGYNAKSLIAVDLSDDEVFAEKKASEIVVPASLAKLFVIDFANTIVNLEDIVSPSQEALAMVKEDSSVANIQSEDYYVENLYAAMLVPSGNDAAYVLADYIGAKLNPEAKNIKERLESFNIGLKNYLKKKGYKSTKINDPSGYDYEATTNTYDIKKVVKNLLQFDWFRNIVSQSEYTAKLPNGNIQTWKNTNAYLDSTNEKYYKSGVAGIKTGSLGNDFNLVILYKKKGKEFLIISLGSNSNTSRYDDVSYVLRSIDDSHYLFN